MFGSAVKIRPKEGDVYFDVVAVVDPVTRDAQKLAPLLSVGLGSIIRADDPANTSVSNLFLVVCHLFVLHGEGFEAACEHQPEGFHELSVQAVRYATKKVKHDRFPFSCVVLDIR